MSSFSTYNCLARYKHIIIYNYRSKFQVVPNLAASFFVPSFKCDDVCFITSLYITFFAVPRVDALMVGWVEPFLVCAFTFVLARCCLQYGYK